MIKIKGIETYIGGKGAEGTYQTIINHIRPHETLIIPFLGNCAVTRAMKKPKKVIGIDKDSRVINLWKAMSFDWMELFCGDGISFLKQLRAGNIKDTVVYCDPPYPINSRRTKKTYYKYEMSDDNHASLLSVLRDLNCDVLISTYPNTLYAEMLKDWNCYTFKSKTRKGMATEALYTNFNNDAGQLHDYSFLGKNYRERERIKKKINRWVKKLDGLNTKERNAILFNLLQSTLIMMM